MHSRSQCRWSRTLYTCRKLVRFGSVLLMVTVACSSVRERQVINLLDQMTNTQLDIPWRVVLLRSGHRSLLENARGLEATDDGRIAQCNPASVMRFHPTLDYDGTLVVHVAYKKAWDEPGEIVARLVEDGRVVERSGQRLRGDRITLRLKCHASTNVRLELVHWLDIGREIPIQWVAAGEAKHDASERNIENLELMLRSLSGTIQGTGIALPKSRYFRLSVDCCSREGVLFGDRDILELNLPPDHGTRRLRFWYSGLAGLAENHPRLRLEARRADRWQVIDEWIVPLRRMWEAVEVPAAHIPPGCLALRFTFLGPSALMFVAEPILIPVKPSRARWNLILIDLDTARADRFGCYGYTERPTSARLDSFVEEKGFAVFGSAYSSAPYTVPATARFLTSRYHGASHDVASLDGNPPMLAEIMRDNGYYCAAFTGGGCLRTPGFDRGFHEFHWDGDLGKVDLTFPDAQDWLHITEEPFFLFLHTFEPHMPYTRTHFVEGLPRGRLLDPSTHGTFLPRDINLESDLSRAESLYVQALYDGGIREASDAVADVFSLMDSLGLWSRTAVVILSDHGEEFWEHFVRFGSHGHSLYDELLRVPFMIYYPGRKEPLSIPDAVSTVDLVPTVANLLGLSWSGDADGIDLLPLIDGKDVTRRVPIMAYVAIEAPRCGGVCIFKDGLKYMETVRTRNAGIAGTTYENRRKTRELYRLHSDPGETRNLVDVQPDIASAMEETLLAAQQQAMPPLSVIRLSESGVMAAKLRKQLVKLGYITEE